MYLFLSLLHNLISLYARRLANAAPHHVVTNSATRRCGAGWRTRATCSGAVHSGISRGDACQRAHYAWAVATGLAAADGWRNIGCWRNSKRCMAASYFAVGAADNGVLAVAAPACSYYFASCSASLRDVYSQHIEQRGTYFHLVSSIQTLCPVRPLLLWLSTGLFLLVLPISTWTSKRLFSPAGQWTYAGASRNPAFCSTLAFLMALLC